jgi:fumarate reductase flavoprotein subunit
MDKKALLLFGAVLLCLMFTACPAGMEDYTVHDPWGTKTGTATESASGYGGLVTVKLTMASGLITAVEIEGPYELGNGNIGQIAIASAPDIIISRNSFEIDTLAGASKTTNAIKEAGQAAIDAIPPPIP